MNSMLISADLSQIEIVLAAQISQDPTLIQLLNDNRDMHRFIVASIYNEDETKIEKTDPRRKDAKSGTFGILYGNGAATLSANTGQTLEWCKDFITTFYKLFPGIKRWHTVLLETVEHSTQITTFTGRRLIFRKYPAKFEWQKKQGITESYNPSDIKNWPIQSTAADIYKLWLTEIWKVSLWNRDKWLLINTIHDSVMFDCRPKYVDKLQTVITDTIDKLPDMIYKIYDTQMVVPIKAEIVIGERWSDL